MYIFSEKDIRDIVKVDKKALSLIEEGFKRFEEGEVTLPPILRVDIPENNGEVDVKTAYIKGMDKFALKISSGFFDNYKIGLPSLSGMMLLFSTETGVPEAVLQDNGYLTDVRTAVAGAMAAKFMAKEEIDTVGVIGTGTQARYQVKALSLVREFKRIVVYGRTPEHVEKYKRDMEEEFKIPVVAVENPEEAVSKSDILITTTPAKEPIIQAEWIKPGLHITAMGSDAEEKNELHPEVLKKADLLSCDVVNQVFTFGEHHHAKEAGLVSEEDSIIELGALAAGNKKGRTSDEQITVTDLTGTGVQDTAIAVYGYDRLREQEKGVWFGEKE